MINQKLLQIIAMFDMLYILYGSIRRLKKFMNHDVILVFKSHSLYQMLSSRGEAGIWKFHWGGDCKYNVVATWLTKPLNKQIRLAKKKHERPFFQIRPQKERPSLAARLYSQMETRKIIPKLIFKRTI